MFHFCTSFVICQNLQYWRIVYFARKEVKIRGERKKQFWNESLFFAFVSGLILIILQALNVILFVGYFSKVFLALFDLSLLIQRIGTH